MSDLALGDHVLVKIRANARSATPKSVAEEKGLPESEQPMGHIGSTRSSPLLEEPGVVRFIGKTQFEDGEWVGVELRTPCGKNDGSVRRVRYFECEENCGIFVRRQMLTRVDPSTSEDFSSSTLPSPAVAAPPASATRASAALPAGKAEGKEETKVPATSRLAADSWAGGLWCTRLLDYQAQIQSLAEEAKKECGPLPQVDADAKGETQWTFEKWFDSLDFTKAFAKKVEGAVWRDEASCGKLMWVFMRQLVKQDVGDGKELLRKLLEKCDVLEMLVETLWEGGKELALDDAASGRELSSKFVLDGCDYEMSYGSLTGFSGGLDQLVGPPSRHDLKDAMRCEHDDEEYFMNGTYGIKTCPKIEWMFATGNAAPDGGWPAEDEARCPQDRRRRAKHMEWLYAKMAWKNKILRQHDAERSLTEPEVIGLRLYTGPMRQIYNSLLRALAHKKMCAQKQHELREMDAKLDKMHGEEKRACRIEVDEKKKTFDELQRVMKHNFMGVAVDGHKYATTIHVINSGLVKLGKIQRAEKVYRGLSGGILPAQFWEKDALGFSGGVENAFLSTTRDREEALFYASRDGHAATVFEIQMAMVDRGADLEWISQYPHEKELSFTPFTGLQVLSTRVEGSTLVVEARLSANLIPLTMEDFFAKRLNVVKQLCEELCDEVHNSVMKAEGMWGQVATALGCDSLSQSWCNAVGQLRSSLATDMERVTTRDAQEMDNTENFVEAIREAVDVKNNFLKPTHDSIMPFLTPELTCFDVEAIGLSALDVTDRFVQSVVERCKKLERVGFANCLKLTDNAAMYIAVWCPSVKHADFSACSGLTNRAMQYLADGCTELRRVDVVHCGKITEEGLQCLPRNCKIAGRENVETEGLEASYGCESDFFSGLERLIGTARPDLLRAMEQEHCDMPDSKVDFCTYYGIITTARTEWLFATGEAPPDGGWPAETRDCRPEDCRKQQPHSWLEEQRTLLNAKLKEHAVPELSWEEVLGLRLFTGPMYRQYRAALRAIARKRSWDAAREQMGQGSAADEGSQEEAEEEALESQNVYTTTIHVISAALLKLGRIEKAGTVYRAMPSANLPSHFWQADTWGVHGGVEQAFLSGTRERHLAMKSAQSYTSGPGTVLEIRTGAVGRGANLGWVSQHPHDYEARVWFPPLTMLEVISSREEDSVLVLEVRPYVHCTSLTMEEVVGRRHKVLAEVCEELCDRVCSRAMQEGADRQEVADLRRSVAARMRSLVAGKSPAEMNDAGKFVDAMQDAGALAAREFE